MLGVGCGLAAGALWGLVFLAPELASEFTPLQLAAGRYVAYGTPFAGELARAGENLRAPLEAIYLLTQGPENRITDVDKAEAARTLLRNLLFFAEDPQLVQTVFLAALDLVEQVPVRRLTFLPEPGAWNLIQ